MPSTKGCHLLFTILASFYLAPITVAELAISNLVISESEIAFEEKL